MFRTIFLIMTVLFIAIAGGSWSVHYALTHLAGFDRLQIGQWEAFPGAGTENADPYTAARAARRGDAAPGRAEGLAFYLWNDDEGRPLSSRCRYRLRGFVPEAGFFTLYTADKDLKPAGMTRLLPTQLYSRDIIHDEDAGMTITISSTAEPGNWLAVQNRQTYGLVLTLYDTPIVTTTGLDRLVMPRVERIRDRRCG